MFRVTRKKFEPRSMMVYNKHRAMDLTFRMFTSSATGISWSTPFFFGE